MKTSIIIPAYYATQELEDMTLRCVESIGDDIDEVILQVDEAGEGYSKTTNKGLERASGDILVVGNNDLTFPVGWAPKLLRVLEEGFDIATCWTSDQNYMLENLIKDGDKFGSLFAMTREVYETIGGFDEQFKGYFSDDDYRMRAKEAGFRIGMNCGLVVEHKAKATYKQVDPGDTEYLRSMRLFEAKWGFLP